MENTEFRGQGANLVRFRVACWQFRCAQEIGLAATLEETTFEGRRITEIRIVDEHGANVTVKSLALKVAVGKPFDFGDERESLRTLYRTGDFSDIRVAAVAGGRRRASGFHRSPQLTTTTWCASMD